MSEIEDKKQLKFCKDCKWYKRSRVSPEEFSQCFHPDIAPYNAVTGKVFAGWCDIQRRGYETCGKDAKLFEPKETLTARVISFFRKDKS